MNTYSNYTLYITFVETRTRLSISEHINEIFKLFVLYHGVNLGGHSMKLTKKKNFFFIKGTRSFCTRVKILSSIGKILRKIEAKGQK